jgi:hypothetical protein
MMRLLLPAALVLTLLAGGTPAQAATTLLCTGERGRGEIICPGTGVRALEAAQPDDHGPVLKKSGTAIGG